MKKCEITKEEIMNMKDTDDFATARALVSKGFDCEGGPLQPKLLGQVCYTVDFDTGSYHWKQLVV